MNHQQKSYKLPAEEGIKKSIASLGPQSETRIRHDRDLKNDEVGGKVGVSGWEKTEEGDSRAKGKKKSNWENRKNKPLKKAEKVKLGNLYLPKNNLAENSLCRK